MEAFEQMDAMAQLTILTKNVRMYTSFVSDIFLGNHMGVLQLAATALS